jgi:7,8-dihydropterin-6-yl-methyl-4-(beta-D-ribofuranosyl)aminobenzene 5'-phosphate synthase
MNEINLREADKLEATILVDNYTDVLLLQGTEVLQRPLVPPSDMPILAEHGFSCLLRVYKGSQEYTVLMDAGMSAICLFHNANKLGVDFNKIEEVVLSHGHFDHFGGLMEFLKKANREMQLIVHPDAFLQRRINIPIGIQADMPLLSEAALKETEVAIKKIEGPSLLASGHVLVSGEVERVTDFEKGFPWAEAKIDNEWIVDPFRDDQALAINVKGRGLVVIGGCSHAGIINSVKYLQKLSGVNKVHAVLGGFHLTGPIFEPIIGPTIEEMKKIGPDYVAPMHCTGWAAINRFAGEMPEQFLLNSVGTTYVFQ